jgi:ABC-2 type transport system permease protein
VTTLLSTAPTPSDPPPSDRPATPPHRFVRAVDLIAAEWIKLWSLRSTYLALLAAAVATPGIAMIVANDNVGYLRAGQPYGAVHLDPLAISFRGLALAQLIVGVLGALTVTGEFGSGSIRATFVAVPRRAGVLLAKTAVVGAVMLVFGQVLAFGSFLGTQAVLHPVHLGLSVAASGVPRAVFGAACYLAVIAVVGVGVGALVRSTAAAVATVAAFFFLLPQITSALPKPWRDWTADAMPAVSAQQISSLRPNPDFLGVGHSYLLLLSYAVVVPLVGILLVRRRDV